MYHTNPFPVYVNPHAHHYFDLSRMRKRDLKSTLLHTLKVVFLCRQDW